MTQTPQQGGASVHVRGQVPSTDLASLVAFLVEAFPADDEFKDKAHYRRWEVLKFNPDTQRLRLNTYGILRRLLGSKKVQAAFRHGDGSGFLRDLACPDKGFTAKMGGRVFNDDLGGISKHTAQLKRLIAGELDRLGIVASDLLVKDPEAALLRLAGTAKLKGFLEEQPARLVAMEFAKADRPAQAGEKDVARVLSAHEEIQAEDWLENMAGSIAQVQKQRDEEFDELQRDKLLATLRQDFDKTDSQITRFLNFLEDEALSRVRLVVGFAIMQGLAAQVAASLRPEEQAFREYIRRVVDLHQLFGAPESRLALHLDLSAAYGLAADFSVSDEWVKVQHYGCLPVWPESNVQLFESRRVDPASRGVSVLREVSYRFRVNGKDPRNEMLNAFDSRLQRLRQTLVENAADELPVSRVRRSLAEVVFLWLALKPKSPTSDLQTAAQNLAGWLNSQGKVGVARLLADLSSWSGAVDGLAKTLVALLKAKTPKLISHAQRDIDDLYLVVQQGVVDWPAIERSRGKVRDPLIKGGGGQTDNVAWFKQIQVARKPEEVPEPLFSIRIRTKLNERTLREQDSVTVQTRREMPKALLNIAWMPMRVEESADKLKHEARRRAEIDPAWQMGPGVDIWYEPELLKQRRNAKFSEEDQRQYRAAAVAALSVLVYVFLQTLAERLAKEQNQRIPALMLRFQTQGKKAAASEGDHMIYAASQAIESALMRELPVRMQGLVTDGEQTEWQKKGAAFALSSALPLVVGSASKPVVKKIAVVVYATRPCDEFPALPDADGFLFRAKTYLAEAVDEPFCGFRFAFDRMQSHVVESQDDFKNPKLIVEEVSRLYGLGYEHILLISNHFGNRRINRTAQRHSPHSQTAFLDEVAEKFAQVSLYLLRRDVFPATRLRVRDRSESAFEAVGLADHNDFAIINSAERSKEIIPVFTFATLGIVGNDDAARPQSGFCTYFLDADHQVRNVEWRERVRSNILNANQGVRESLLAALRGLHFLEAEKQPEGGIFKPVLDPFGWVRPNSIGAAGEIEAIPASRRKGNVLLSLPALLSHVSDALHRGKG